MKRTEVEYVHYKDIKISNVSYKHAYKIISDTIISKQKGYICLNDVSNIIAATKDKRLKQSINSSLLSIADGTPLAWYARMIGCKEIERISGVCLMERLMKDMTECRHYLLGDTEQTIDKVISEAKRINPNITICGHSPPFKEFDDNDNQQMLERISKADPDIVWVSFGGRKQEKWMNQNINRINKGVMIGVGAAFRWFIGDIITPPQIFQKMGLQWFFRLSQEFVRNPANWFVKVQERDLLASKFKFVMDLPFEIITARNQSSIKKQ